MNLHLETLSDEELCSVASDALGNLTGRFDTLEDAAFITPSQTLDPDRREIYAALSAACDAFDEARTIIERLPLR